MRRTIMRAVVLGAALFAAPVGAGDMDGAQVYKDNCGRCHQPRTPADLSPAGWQAVSFHMRVRAVLSPAEFEALEGFLIPEVEAPADDSILSGNAVAARVCTTCHDTQRIEAAVASGRTEEQWRATLARMRTYGAPISADEADEVAAWLSTLTAEGAP